MMSQGLASPHLTGLSPEERERRMKADPGSLYNMNRIAFFADGTRAFPELGKEAAVGVPVVRCMQHGFVLNANSKI